jgi:hypothetical protein
VCSLLTRTSDTTLGLTITNPGPGQITSGLPTIRSEHGIDYGHELKILCMISLWIANVFRIESKRIRERRELFAAQDDCGRIIAERAATRKLLHLGQHRLG